MFGRGFAWLDTGNPTDLLEAANFIETVQTRQGFYIACIEEIAYRNNWISKEALLKRADAQGKTDYADYLRYITEE